MKKIILLTGGFVVFSVTILCSQNVADTSVTEAAKAYGNQAASIVKDYNLVVQNDRSAAVDAVLSLKKKGAYPIIALALPKAEANLRSIMIDALVRTPGKDKVVMHALAVELEDLNKVTTYQGDEDAAGYHFLILLR